MVLLKYEHGPFSRLWQAHRGIAMALVFLALGCQVELITRYDEQIDRSGTELQQRMDAFLTKLASHPAARETTYTANEEFYDNYQVALRAMLLRAQSQPKNARTEQQLGLMLQNVDQLRAAHQAGRLDPAAVGAFRDLFNQGWRAVITLELAKKRGQVS
jgi:hypothetical protein